MTWPNWSEVAEVLKALAAVLWPVAIIVVILTFRKDVRGLIAGLKLRRGKLFGQEFEFELDKLEKETRPLAEPSSTAAQQPPTDILQRILREAASSPKAALMYLQAEIERQLRAVLASRGVDPRDVRSVPYQRAMDLFRGSDEVSQEFPRWLQEFRNIRNIIIHGHEATDEDALRAIDIGARILSVLNTTLAAKVVTDSKASGTLQQTQFKLPLSTSRLIDVFGSSARCDVATTRTLVLVSPKLSHHGAEGRLQTLALAILVFTTVVVFPSKTQAQQQRSLSCIAQHVLTSPTWTEYFDITDTARYLRILEGDKYGVKQIHEPSSTSGRTLNFSDMRGTIDVTTCSPTLVQSG